MVKFLSKISPKINQMSFNEELLLDKNFSIKTIPFQYLDSMCLININGFKILNLNDCDIKNVKQLKTIKNLCGQIDLLMVQFSYAIGKSNKEDINERKNWSNKILKNLSNTINYLKPHNVIPFASFCYFSRYDNFYLNDSINKIGPTIFSLKKNHPNTNFLTFYPGDVWDLKSNWDNVISINKYDKHYNNISPIQIDYKRIDFSINQEISRKFIYTTKKKITCFPCIIFLIKKI